MVLSRLLLLFVGSTMASAAGASMPIDAMLVGRHLGVTSLLVRVAVPGDKRARMLRISSLLYLRLNDMRATAWRSVLLRLFRTGPL